MVLLSFPISLKDDGSFKVMPKCRHEVKHTFTHPDAVGILSIKAGLNNKNPFLPNVSDVSDASNVSDASDVIDKLMRLTCPTRSTR